MLDHEGEERDVLPEPPSLPENAKTFVLEAGRVMAALEKLNATGSLTPEQTDRLRYLASAVATVKRVADRLPAARADVLFRAIIALKDALYAKKYDAVFWRTVDEATENLATFTFADAAIENAKHEIDDARANAVKSVGEAVQTAIDASLSQLEGLLKEVSARGEQTVALVRKQINDAVLDDANQQFLDAQKRMRWQVAIWAALSSLVVAGFFGLAAYLMVSQEQVLERHADWTWQLLYYGALRLAVLGAIGAIASFCLRMLKAHLRMAHTNGHRARVIRSTPGFLEAAPAQNRFAVLELIIHSLVTESDALRDDNPEVLSGESALVFSKLASGIKSKSA